MNTRHCMIDLETLGNSHDAAIVQIGFCIFDMDKIIATGERCIDFDDAIKYGTVSGSTLKWWMEQSAQARSAILRSNKHDTLEDALAGLVSILKEYNPVHFWAHATFDFPILANAFRSVGMDNPIGYRQTRDLRTLDMLANATGINNWPVREGTHHNALDDAVHQAKCVHLMLKKIGYTW